VTHWTTFIDTPRAMSHDAFVCRSSMRCPVPYLGSTTRFLEPMTKVGEVPLRSDRRREHEALVVPGGSSGERVTQLLSAVCSHRDYSWLRQLYNAPPPASSWRRALGASVAPTSSRHHPNLRQRSPPRYADRGDVTRCFAPERVDVPTACAAYRAHVAWAITDVCVRVQAAARPREARKR
jgi:hypothetical protein